MAIAPTRSSVGTSPSSIRRRPPEVAQSGGCDLELEIAARNGRFEEEGWRVRKGGELFWSSVIITAIADERSQLRGFVKVTRDLTEKKRHEEELALEMSQRLAAEKTAHLAEPFVAVLGHDLRNPLNAITIAAGVVSRDATTERTRRAAARITSSGHRMERMIAALLDFTRLRLGGGIALNLKPTVLTDLCNNVVEELQSIHQETQVKCSAVGDTAGTWDPDRLEQALSNLVSNAIQHAAKGRRSRSTSTAAASRWWSSVSTTRGSSILR